MVADLNDSEGQYKLWRSYYHGCGVQKNYVETVRLYRLATEQKDSYQETQYAFGECLRFGQNLSEAIHWFNLGVEEKDSQSPFAPPQCFRLGKGEKVLKKT